MSRVRRGFLVVYVSNGHTVQLHTIYLKVVVSYVRRILRGGRRLRNVVLRGILKGPGLRITHAFSPSSSRLYLHASITQGVRRPPIKGPRVIIRTRYGLELIFTGLEGVRVVGVVVARRSAHHRIKVPSSGQEDRASVNSAVMKVERQDRHLRGRAQVIRLIMELMPNRMRIRRVVMMNHRQRPLMVTQRVRTILLLELRVEIAQVMLMLTIMISTTLGRSMSEAMLIRAVKRNGVRVVHTMTSKYG